MLGPRQSLSLASRLVATLTVSLAFHAGKAAVAVTVGVVVFAVVVVPVPLVFVKRLPSSLLDEIIIVGEEEIGVAEVKAGFTIDYCQTAALLLLGK